MLWVVGVVLAEKNALNSVTGFRAPVNYKNFFWLGAVAHACNPSTLGAKTGGLLELRSLRPAWATWQNPVSTKNTKISWAFWHAPVTPATQEAEAGESPEPGRQRLQWAEIVPLLFSLGNKSKTPSQNKNQKLKKKTTQSYTYPSFKKSILLLIF